MRGAFSPQHPTPEGPHSSLGPAPALREAADEAPCSQCRGHTQLWTAGLPLGVAPCGSHGCEMELQQSLVRTRGSKAYQTVHKRQPRSRQEPAWSPRSTPVLPPSPGRPPGAGCSLHFNHRQTLGHSERWVTREVLSALLG